MPDLRSLLAAVVADVGGTERTGQVQMVEAVAEALSTHQHLLVQAGTGTGKSLGYLVPAVLHAVDSGSTVVVATATLALQGQLIERDLPQLCASLTTYLGREPSYAVVKGRRNYLCQNKLDGGFPDDEGAFLTAADVQAQASALGAEVVRLREWAQDTDTGDRDDLVPGVSERAWRQVSVSARECLGGKCPLAADCYVERVREQARGSDIVVTNHAFLAIDAFQGRQLLPAHDVLIVDEAHELADRVTATVTQELAAGMVAAAVKRVGRLADCDDLSQAGEGLLSAVDGLESGRITVLSEALAGALTLVRDSARAVQSQLKTGGGSAADGGVDAGKAMARAAVDELFEVAARLADPDELDVTWLDQDPRRGPILRVAPMSVAMTLRDRVFTDRTVVLTSATLELGGSFEAAAGRVGLRGDGAPAWTGLDVGSPFDYGRQGIVYVARHLPAPGREGTSQAVMTEVEDLIRAAGGRTLGLFSSMRAAQAVAEEMRQRLGEDLPVLCQGEDQTRTLVRQFAESATSCLFGTLSLWQGVDVPGSACQLVLVDRIPFPRPDDPLTSARTQAIARRGGNGFMAVSATHAALRLAQGTGRLIRRADDRGVVAILDSRMVTARYAGFLQSSLAPFWPTTDRSLVLDALRRLDASAPPVMPLSERSIETGLGNPQGSGQGTETGPAPTASGARTAVTLGTGWTVDTDQELREGLQLGLAPQEVAERLDVETSAVDARMTLFGMDPPEPDHLG